jgi:hypothetical protein
MAKGRFPKWEAASFIIYNKRISEKEFNDDLISSMFCLP